METPPTLGERIEGRKTYLTAIGFAILGSFKIWDRRWEDGIEMLLVALATASLRHAIARKSVSPKEPTFLEDHD